VREFAGPGNQQGGYVNRTLSSAEFLSADPVNIKVIAGTEGVIGFSIVLDYDLWLSAGYINWKRHAHFEMVWDYKCSLYGKLAVSNQRIQKQDVSVIPLDAQLYPGEFEVKAPDKRFVALQLRLSPPQDDPASFGLSYGVASVDFGSGISFSKTVVMMQLKAVLDVVDIVEPALIPKSALEHLVYFDLNRADWSASAEYLKLKAWKDRLETRAETKKVFELIRQGKITIHIRAYTDRTGKVYPTNHTVSVARALKVSGLLLELVGGHPEIDATPLAVHPAAPVGKDAASRVAIIELVPREVQAALKAAQE
jgi:hypothetical protein